MPSGKIHDVVTYVLAVPTAVGFFFLTRNAGLAALGTGMMVFGGLMFGPDLDTHSQQYTRWGLFRWIWFPYKRFFPHRSSWTHGLLWSTLLRVLYFTTVVTLFLALMMYIQNVFVFGMPANGEQALMVMRESSRRMSRLFAAADRKLLLVTFIGLWWGAATHTISDVLGSALKSMFRTF